MAGNVGDATGVEVIIDSTIVGVTGTTTVLTVLEVKVVEESVNGMAVIRVPTVIVVTTDGQYVVKMVVFFVV